MSRLSVEGGIVKGLALVVVNYNAKRYLNDCLQAIFTANQQPEKIIVVDNASSDESLFAAQAAFPQVNYLPQTENLGFAAGNNAGFAEAAGMQWVACINPDAFVEPDWLDALLPFMQDEAKLDFLSCQLVDAEDQNCIDGAGDCYHVSGLIWRRLHGVNEDRSSNLPFFSPCGAAALYRKAAIDELGGFDAEYFCYAEDVDLGFRLRLAGFNGQHVSSARARHIGSGITGRESDFSIYHGHRNLVWTYVKNMPTRLLWRYLPQHLLMSLVSVFYYLGKGRMVILKAKWHALKGLPRVLVQRKQTIRRASDETIHAAMVAGWTRAYWGRQR